MSVSLSVFYPDMQLKESDFNKALTRIAMDLTKPNYKSIQSIAPEVELHFMLAGRLDIPGFTGMRIRTFDTKSNKILIEAAVPKEFNYSAQAHNYVTAAMMDAVENASEFLVEHEIGFDLQGHLALIESLTIN